MKFKSLLPILLLAACSSEDPNSKPVFGKDMGLPANCRAYIQVAVNEWRKGTYSSEVTMDAIERNCGEDGSLWSHKPD